MASNEVIGFLCNPGPGDALRFLHAFCELLQDTGEKGILYCLKNARKYCASLVTFFRKNNGAGIELIYLENMEELRDTLLEKTEGGLIFHAFEVKYFVKNTKVFPDEFLEGLPVKLMRIDCYKDQHYMRNRLQDHFDFARKQTMPNKLGLIFIRNTDIVIERNMSREILAAILEYGKENGIDFHFAGSPFPEQYKDLISKTELIELYPKADYPAYYDQICRYSQYSFAIGMNSGGLDMAAAGGVPIIRIGEFHQYYSHLGQDFNTFLNGNYVLNIASNGETDISNITERTIYKALDMLLHREKENCGIVWI